MINQIKPYIFLSFVSLILMTACSNEPDLVNPDGTFQQNYGKTMVTSMVLTQEQVTKLNELTLAKQIKPFNQLADDEKLQINFAGDSNLNPYRVVIVAEGNAIFNEEVDVQFAGVLQKVNADPDKLSDRPIPQLYREEDNQTYRVSQKTTLRLVSEPFSFNAQLPEKPYFIRTMMTKNDNFHFDSLEIQIWQGIGEAETSYRNYKLFMILIIGGFLAYRMIFARL